MVKGFPITFPQINIRFRIDKGLGKGKALGFKDYKRLNAD